MAPGIMTTTNVQDEPDPEQEDVDDNWVQQQTSLGLPLILPWKRQAVPLGTCFSSRRQQGDPWLKENPFILSHFYKIPKVLRSEYGSTCSFNSVSTTSMNETGKHLSLGFGVGVGLPFLCSASVKGTYDEHLAENKDSNKSSIRTSVRGATVELEEKPRLSHQAMAMLKYGGGYSTFVETYGDYFVWGYRLGGDCGLLVSSSSFSSKKDESYGIKVTVEVLFVSVSKTWTKDFHSFSAGKSMKMAGYDTLSNMTWRESTEEGGLEPLVAKSEQAIASSQNMLDRLVQVLSDQGMNDGDHLTAEQCEYLTSNGIAVELVLLPMTTLRDVARWTTEKNII